jgi:hypothetical protein
MKRISIIILLTFAFVASGNAAASTWGNTIQIQTAWSKLSQSSKPINTIEGREQCLSICYADASFACSTQGFTIVEAYRCYQTNVAFCRVICAGY